MSQALEKVKEKRRQLVSIRVALNRLRKTKAAQDIRVLEDAAKNASNVGTRIVNKCAAIAKAVHQGQIDKAMEMRNTLLEGVKSKIQALNPHPQPYDFVKRMSKKIDEVIKKRGGSADPAKDAATGGNDEDDVMF